MKKIVIFSVEELFDLLHDEPVFDKKSNTIYMSQDCHDNEDYFRSEQEEDYDE